VAVVTVLDITDGRQKYLCDLILGDDEANRDTRMTIWIWNRAQIHPSIAQSTSVNPFDQR